MIRAALAVAVAAVLVASAALTAALREPVPPSWPLVCGEQFHDTQTGQTVPMYYPCSPVRPRP